MSGVWQGAPRELWGTSWWERLLWAKVEDPSDDDAHWIWTGSVQKRGGVIQRPVLNFVYPDGTRSNNQRPAAVLYEWLHGSLDGLRLWRTCDEVLCVNPHHHDATVTGRPDVLVPTHCIRGHELDLAVASQRGCRTCDAERKRRERARRREAGVERVPPTKTHYPHGHALVGDNLRWSSDGYASCATCAGEAHRAWLASSAVRYVQTP